MGVVSRRQLFVIPSALALVGGGKSPVYGQDEAQVQVLNESLVFENLRIEFSLNKDCSYEVYDGQGKKLERGNSQGKRITFRLSSDGYYLLALPSGKVPFIVCASKPQLAEDPVWGVCTNFSNPPLRGIHLPHKLVPDLAKVGVSSIRDTYLWSELEKEAGVYRESEEYRERDQIFSANRILTFYNASSTHGSYGPWRNLDSPQTQEEYAKHIVRLLKARPHLTSVEIYNEFNGSFNLGKKDGASYASLLKKVYPIIKQAHPEVRIIAGSTAGVAFSFAQDCFAHGGVHFMDAWSLHPYSVSGQGIFHAINKLQGMMEEYGGVKKPCILSEVGYSITSPQNHPGLSNEVGGNNAKVHSEVDQANNLTQVLSSAWLSPGVEASYWYNALTTASHTERAKVSVQATEGSFGLFTLPLASAPHAYAPRRSAYAYYGLRTMLEQAGEYKKKVEIAASSNRSQDIFGAQISDSSYLLFVSGWLSGEVQSRGFEKKLSLKKLDSSLPEASYWKISHPVSGKVTYGYGREATVGADARILKLSERPFNEGESYSVHGAIASYYQQRGGEEKFGLAVSAQEEILGGYRQFFSKKQTIYWHPQVGAYALYQDGAIGRRWSRNQGLAGWGWPSSSEERVEGLGNWRQFFHQPETGSKSLAYWSSQKGVVLLDANGSIYRAWQQAGAEQAWGYPMTDEETLADGSKRVIFSGMQAVYRSKNQKLELKPR